MSGLTGYEAEQWPVLTSLVYLSKRTVELVHDKLAILIFLYQSNIVTNFWLVAYVVGVK